jgi:putative two-component system response regulator
MGRARATAEILIVDDEAAIRQLLRHVLEEEGHAVSLAANAAEARRLIQSKSFDVALCDIQMPGESGLSLAAHIASEYPDTAAVMITALDNADLAETTVAFGAFGYIVKPFRRTELLATVSSALRAIESAGAGRRERDRLEHRLIEQTAELRDALQRLQEQEMDRHGTDAETMNRLARAIEYRSHETGDHIKRVASYSALVADGMGLDREETERIRVASVMHDVGKVAIPDHILLKPGSLTAEERQEMERHAEIGREVLEASEGDLMHLAAAIAWSHHERFDGEGYPRGLRGDAIPLEGRIVAVADVFDALTQDRVYRPALPLDQTLGIMAEGRGTHFDTEALDPFLASLDDALAIANVGPAAAGNGNGSAGRGLGQSL